MDWTDAVSERDEVLDAMARKHYGKEHWEQLEVSEIESLIKLYPDNFRFGIR